MSFLKFPAAEEFFQILVYNLTCLQYHCRFRLTGDICNERLALFGNFHVLIISRQHHFDVLS